MRWKAEGGNGYKVGEKEKEKRKKNNKKKEWEGKGMRRRHLWRKLTICQPNYGGI